MTYRSIPCGTRTRARSRGLSLIELMISMVIGLLVLAGVLYVYSGSRQTYVYNEALSRLQENGRIAIDALSHDLRMAGYFGCRRLDSKPPVKVIANAAPVTSLSSDNMIEDVDTGSAPFVAGSSGVLIRRGGDVAFPLAAGLPTESSPITLSVADAFEAGDLALITDCQVADFFRVSGVAGTTVTHAGANSGALSKAYFDDALVFGFREDTYTVRNTGRLNQAGNPIVSLFRNNNELVEGVENMSILFGVGDPVTGDVQRYVPADLMSAADWGRVTAIRVNLLLASVEDSILTDAQPYRFDSALDGASGSYQFNTGALIVPADRKMRQVFTTTVALRNRLS